LLEIRPTRPEDLPALGSLFEDRFGHGLAAAEHAWKYRRIPGEGRSLVAVEDGAVLAHAGALALPARWPGGEGPIWQLVDFAGTTRRRGLRAALVDLGRTLLADLPRPGDAPWIYGFPSERHFRLGERVFGYRPLTEIEALAGALPGAPAPGTQLGIGDSCLEWGAEAEAAWACCGGFGVRRSAAFLNWRYWARPQRYYRFYRMLSGDQQGFAVFAFLGEEAWAAEVWLPPAGRWYAPMLDVAADLRAAGFRAWRFWPGPGLRPDLAGELGLRPSGDRRFIGSRGQPVPGFPCSMGDYDLV
jgi:hypothetical protein